MKVTIHLGVTGKTVGDASEFDLLRYAHARRLVDRHARASDVLTEEDLKRLGLSGSERIFARFWPQYPERCQESR